MCLADVHGGGPASLSLDETADGDEKEKKVSVPGAEPLTQRSLTAIRDCGSQADSGVIRGLGLGMGLGGQAGDAVAMEDEQGNAADELNALAAGETLSLGRRLEQDLDAVLW